MRWLKSWLLRLREAARQHSRTGFLAVGADSGATIANGSRRYCRRHQGGPLENADLPVLYVPFDQNPVGWFAILVRTSPTEQSVLKAIPPPFTGSIATFLSVAQ